MLNYIVRCFNNDPASINLNTDFLSYLFFALCTESITWIEEHVKWYIYMSYVSILRSTY
jgi:hypothetical protein